MHKKELCGELPMVHIFSGWKESGSKHETFMVFGSVTDPDSDTVVGRTAPDPDPSTIKQK
jgi:hypothetical protein